MNILDDYQETKMALDILSKEVEEKKQAVIEYLKTQLDNKAETSTATFLLRKNCVYKYSDRVEKLDAKIAESTRVFRSSIEYETELLVKLRKNEEKEGKAEVIKETFTPVMSLKKEKGGE
jgi:cation transport regulator ChaC